METPPEPGLMERIANLKPSLTPKGRQLADFVVQNPRQAVFLRTRGLAAECGVSESTVVRFVGQLGFAGYGDFIQALRDHLDRDLTLVDRVELSQRGGPGADRIRRDIFNEIANLHRLAETLDPQAVAAAVARLAQAPRLYLVGSRLSYALAYYLGWALSRLRPEVHTLAGSDTTAIDTLSLAPAGSLVVIVATSRYPNELLRLARLTRRLGLELLVISDSSLCPLNQFASHSLVAPCRHIPVVGSPNSLICLINCLIGGLVDQGGEALRQHQLALEQTYLENDLLFNLEEPGRRS
ncbi:MAG: MurR/RpiR family transcriptional regulator [Deltaproteobacteria bacterium]|nr:MurR/RpiR family transcriptional regulator [Deltaproteobacteria bacterium]